jgi:hypothetical protein
MQIWTLRRTELADAQELVRLRGLMLQALGQDSGLADAAWRAEARDWFAERLARRRDWFVAYVIGSKPVNGCCLRAGRGWMSGCPARPAPTGCAGTSPACTPNPTLVAAATVVRSWVSCWTGSNGKTWPSPSCTPVPRERHCIDQRASS